MNHASLFLCMVLAAVMAVVLWEGVMRCPNPAYAQPRAPLDAGAQRLQAINLQKATNAKLDQTNTKLDELVKLLTSGKVRVRVLDSTKKQPPKSSNDTKKKK